MMVKFCSLSVLLAFVTIKFIDCVILDLHENEFPSCIDIFTGTFNGGGVYRMFHSRNELIRTIHYGGHILATTRFHRALPEDIYVQEYKRDGISIISLHIFFNRSTKTSANSYYQIAGGHIRIIGRDKKLEFVGGPIYLSIDVNVTKYHPLIVKTMIGSPLHKHIWQLATAKHFTDHQSKISRLRFRQEVYYMSPVLNIDTEQSDYLPPTALIGQFSKVQVSKHDGVIEVSLKRLRASFCQLIQIPPTIDNIFKPCRIISLPHYYNHLDLTIKVNRHVTLTIDVASLEVNVPDLIILSNLKRGNWIYTQYTVVPITDQRFVLHKVINSQMAFTLYEAQEHCYVSYVELFKHIIHGWQYVVINIKQASNIITPGPTEFIDVKRIYMLTEISAGAIYVDLSMTLPKEHLDILYNINVMDEQPSIDQPAAPANIDVMQCDEQ
ncbi:uncharacterized protein BBOV_IV003980 [Babesia bovis T2Bo]|uniref:Uncharacterized protein n=1 Tax=Babesia bovis TaxID=5865 RepID=A7AQE0_BABBO|nr:uncharacterized protein BBOV_IV003980 [Babesia bovis T2Bo]EDO06759.1 hypothetical protein BBOV_IV003980 [Babesia bovis T2Bo]|eukprot:XP_001610327.1 hypothetical protein [Babesia bovis T2Bo]